MCAMPDSPTLAILSAPEDAPFVNRLSADLSAAGYRVFDIAGERLHEDPCNEPGELRRRLEPAHAVLVVVSPHAVHSEQVRCEIEFARLLDPPKERQRLVPLLLAATDVPYSLKNLHAIYFTAGPYEGALQRLTAHLASPESETREAAPAAESGQRMPAVAGAAAAMAPAPEPRVSEPAAATRNARIAPAVVQAVAPEVAPQAGVSYATTAGTSATPARRRSFWRALFSRQR